jgi:hypothetical protein
MTSAALKCSGALALAVLCAASDTRAGKDGPLPYRVRVVVEWGQPAGPESFRADLEHAIVAEISMAACFRAVRTDPLASPGPDDLQLRVTVHDYDEEIDFEYSVADRANPGVNLDRLMVARLQGDFRAEVSTVLEEATVREDRFRQQSSWRPVYREDPREEAQRLLVESVARATRKFACKGSAGRWSKQLESARATVAR